MHPRAGGAVGDGGDRAARRCSRDCVRRLRRRFDRRRRAVRRRRTCRMATAARRACQRETFESPCADDGEFCTRDVCDGAGALRARRIAPRLLPDRAEGQAGRSPTTPTTRRTSSSCRCSTRPGLHPRDFGDPTTDGRVPRVHLHGPDGLADARRGRSRRYAATGSRAGPRSNDGLHATRTRPARDDGITGARAEGERQAQDQGQRAGAGARRSTMRRCRSPTR